MIKVRIQCKQMMHFDQEVEMSESDYEKIKDFDMDSIDEHGSMRQEYSIIEGHIDFRDVFDSDSQFEDITITKIG